MGWIQEGVRNLFERLDNAVDDWIFEDMKKTVRRQREHLLKMEHMAKMAKMEVGKKTVRRQREHLLKMEVGKDAGMGWIQGGVRNLFGHLDKAVDDWIDKDFKKTARRQREHLLKMKHLAKMQVWEGFKVVRCKKFLRTPRKGGG